MSKPHKTIVLGPPGTGKTTKLLNIVELELKKVKPNKIAFLSFTRKAIEEAAGRACQKFNFDREDLPWFRTLHSFAYRCTSKSREDIFDRNHCIELGKSLGLFIGYGNNNEEGYSQADTNVGTCMLFIENLSRIKQEPIEQTWREYRDQRIELRKLLWFRERFKQYKEEHGLSDFTDLLEEMVGPYRHHIPTLDVVIVDEAQDLSRLQWKMIEALCEKAKRVYIAGDDDQAIYTWSGADIKTFLSLKVQKSIVLDLSYRLPPPVFELSKVLAARISTRYEKKFNPREAEGSVVRTFDVSSVPLEEGNWLVLSRNRCFSEEMAGYMIQRGIHFSCPFANPISDDVMDGIIAWEALRKGESIPVERARMAYRYLKSGTGVARGFKTLDGLDDGSKVSLAQLKQSFGLRTEDIWHKALERITMVEREYLISILRKHEKIRKPRVHVGTIHGSKGGEADNVLLTVDITRRVQENADRDADLEHRVFYVGATRAKKNLFVLCPTTERYYQV